MKNELDILRDVTGKLETLNTPYMLTGSVAMSFDWAAKLGVDDLLEEARRG